MLHGSPSINTSFISKCASSILAQTGRWSFLDSPDLLISFTLIKVKEQVRGFLAGSVVKDPPANTRDADWIPSLGWEDPLEKEMSTHSHSCLGNPTDKRAWWVTVQGVADELGTTWWLNKSGESKKIHLSEPKYLRHICLWKTHLLKDYHVL